MSILIIINVKVFFSVPYFDFQKQTCVLKDSIMESSERVMKYNGSVDAFELSTKPFHEYLCNTKNCQSLIVYFHRFQWYSTSTFVQRTFGFCTFSVCNKRLQIIVIIIIIFTSPFVVPCQTPSARTKVLHSGLLLYPNSDLLKEDRLFRN